MNPTIDPKVLEALAKKWPQHFEIHQGGYFLMLNTPRLTCAFNALKHPDEAAFPLQHEHLDLIRGRLERIVEESWGELPDYYVWHIPKKCYWVIFTSNQMEKAESTNNYTEALAIAALRAEGVDIAP